MKSHGKRNHICLLPVKHWNHSLAVRIALLWSHCRTVDSNSQRAFAPRCPAAWMQSYDSVVSPIDSRLVLGSARRGNQRSVSNTGECAHSYWVSKPGHLVHLQIQADWDVLFLVTPTAKNNLYCSSLIISFIINSGKLFVVPFKD